MKQGVWDTNGAVGNSPFYKLASCGIHGYLTGAVHESIDDDTLREYRDWWWSFVRTDNLLGGGHFREVGDSVSGDVKVRCSLGNCFDGQS